jgi:hypothetical protein
MRAAIKAVEGRPTPSTASISDISFFLPLVRKPFYSSVTNFFFGIIYSIEVEEEKKEEEDDDDDKEKEKEGDDDGEGEIVVASSQKA